MAFNILDIILEKLETPLAKISELHDTGAFYYIAFGLTVLLITTVIFGTILIIFYKPPSVPAIEQEIVDNAGPYCMQKGFTSWEWINKSAYTFRCYNSTGPLLNLDEYYRVT